MSTPNLPFSAKLRSATAGQVALFVLGLLASVGGYFFWQVVGAFVDFFVCGSGAGHTDEGLLIAAGFLLLHLGILSWLFWRKGLYTTWGAWALSVGVAIGLFAYYTFLPWHGTPPDSAYQRYIFVKNGQHYELTLESPGHSFDVSDVTNRENGSTTSLLMGDYQVRHDTTFLREWAGPRQCFIYHHTLVGFGKNTQAIPLLRGNDSNPLSLRQ